MASSTLRSTRRRLRRHQRLGRKLKSISYFPWPRRPGAGSSRDPDTPPLATSSWGGSGHRQGASSTEECSNHTEGGAGIRAGIHAVREASSGCRTGPPTRQDRACVDSACIANWRGTLAGPTTRTAELPAPGPPSRAEPRRQRVSKLGDLEYDPRPASHFVGKGCGGVDNQSGQSKPRSLHRLAVPVNF